MVQMMDERDMIETEKRLWNCIIEDREGINHQSKHDEEIFWRS